MVQNFVFALEGLALATVQKVWDAVTNLLWGMVESAISIKLPRPMLPSWRLKFPSSAPPCVAGQGGR